MANSSPLCLICGTVLTSDAERRKHIESEHPGMSVRWREGKPYVVDGDTETRIGPSALKRMRRHAREVTGGRAAARGRAVLHKPDSTPRVMVETPLPDDPDAPPYFAQVQPPHLTVTAAPVGPEPTTDGGEGVKAPTAESVSASVSRETIRLALDQPTLAQMIRQLSIVLSEWDGAGERGHLSAIEAGQLAMLLHEPAVSAVQRYFGGNVDRFRLALAVGILLLGKGRIHLAAIAAKRRRAVESVAEGDEIEAARLASTPETVETVAPEPEPLDPVAALAARQREWATTPRVDA